MNEAPSQNATRRRRSNDPQLVTIFWRDIPMQVNAQAGSQRHQVLLPRRFQRAVDAAAMTAGLTKADDYVLQMRRTSVAFTGDIVEAAEAHAQAIDNAYDRARLQTLAANGGYEP